MATFHEHITRTRVQQFMVAWIAEDVQENHDIRESTGLDPRPRAGPKILLNKMDRA